MPIQSVKRSPRKSKPKEPETSRHVISWNFKIIALFGITLMMLIILQEWIVNPNLKANGVFESSIPLKFIKNVLGTAFPEEKVVLNLLSGEDLSESQHLAAPAEPSKLSLLFQSLPNATSRNLILGLAAGIEDKYYAIFCGSIRKVMGPVDVVVFMSSPISERHWEISNKLNIQVVEYNRSVLEPEYLAQFHPSSLRWILFYRLLNAQNRSMYNSHDRVLFADVRDTYFQQDPFAVLPETSEKFYGVAEALGESIGSCSWNSAWVRDCFGESVLELVSNEVISCSGISIGTMDMAYRYVEIMSLILMGKSILASRFPQCERNGVDQGIHNVILHMGLLPISEIKSETDVLITSLQSSPDTGIVDIGQSTDVYIGFTVRAAVVHQYDRIFSLQKALGREFVYWMDMNDEKAGWIKEPACSKYWVTSGQDFFAGRCELGSMRTMTAASCCAACDERRRKGHSCHTFSFSEGVCYLKSCSPQIVRHAVLVSVAKLYSTDPSNSLVDVNSVSMGALLDPKRYINTWNAQSERVHVAVLKSVLENG